MSATTGGFRPDKRRRQELVSGTGEPPASGRETAWLARQPVRVLEQELEQVREQIKQFSRPLEDLLAKAEDLDARCKVADAQWVRKYRQPCLQGFGDSYAPRLSRSPTIRQHAARHQRTSGLSSSNQRSRSPLRRHEERGPGSRDRRSHTLRYGNRQRLGSPANRRDDAHRERTTAFANPPRDAMPSLEWREDRDRDSSGGYGHARSGRTSVHEGNMSGRAGHTTDYRAHQPRRIRMSHHRYSNETSRSPAVSSDRSRHQHPNDDHHRQQLQSDAQTPGRTNNSNATEHIQDALEHLRLATEHLRHATAPSQLSSVCVVPEAQPAVVESEEPSFPDVG